jgi:hypothetical protein
MPTRTRRRAKKNREGDKRPSPYYSAKTITRQAALCMSLSDDRANDLRPPSDREGVRCPKRPDLWIQVSHRQAIRSVRRLTDWAISAAFLEWARIPLRRKPAEPSSALTSFWKRCYGGALSQLLHRPGHDLYCLVDFQFAGVSPEPKPQAGARQGVAAAHGS